MCESSSSRDRCLALCWDLSSLDPWPVWGPSACPKDMAVWGCLTVLTCPQFAAWKSRLQTAVVTKLMFPF